MTAAVVLTLGIAMAGAALAQEAEAPTPKPPAKAEPRQTRLLRVQVVLSRFTGEKKLTSLPYTMLVSSDRKNVSLRMGVEVPVPMPPSSVQYRNVGTNIDCRAEEKADGLYQIELKVENSSVYSGPGTPGQEAPPRAENQPMFRTFNVSLSPVLRDGQTVQAVASTDPVTGEVVKIDVTMNVVK